MAPQRKASSVPEGKLVHMSIGLSIGLSIGPSIGPSL
jgi:hypothetical protein